MKGKYFCRFFQSVPLLPIIYFQGKKIKREIKILPDAENPEGFTHIGDEKTLKIIFIGESSFAGVGVKQHENAFAGHFCAYFSKKIQNNIHWKVYAKSGYNIEKIQQKIIPLINDDSCNLFVIGIGGNDTFELTSAKKWRKNIQILINQLNKKFPTAPILFAQLPTIEEFPAFPNEMKFVLGSYKDFLAHHLHVQVLKNENIFFPTAKINVKEWLATLDEGETVSAFFSDGIHPSERCYALWANDCVKFLMDLKIKFP